MIFYESKFVWWCLGAWAMGWVWVAFGEEGGTNAIGAVIWALIIERLVVWKVNRNIKRADKSGTPSKLTE